MSPIPLNDLKRHNAPLATALKQASERVIDSGWYILGGEVTAFERDFAAYCGTASCIGVGNGTDALELALRALGIGPGDRVATVANAGMYASSAICAVGARPVFVDIDPLRLTIDPASLAAKITGRVKAVIVTHLYGRLADLAGVRAVCGDLPIIEDCAQAHGAERDGVRAGAFGALGCFSFFPTKNLGALGDGGAVVTSDPALAEALVSLRQYGWATKYQASRPGGRNSRLDEMQAAILRVKLPLLDGWNARRRAICARYRDALPDGAMPETGMDDVAHLAVARMKDRDAVQARLAGAGIQTAIHYPIADYDQPALRHLGLLQSLPETARALAEIVTLPCFPELTDAEVERVVEALA
ncbi:erythromycin biosynthesis sensory transduction protein eryC1 [Paramagnetospirillum kuznetsovii]|uniref:Erythromycin biosynthesis sensory transduction protein eryC1 n=1 Tax=Paramagnetospirillum kuznetsovii TaxID=2053833 RepID=A0A364P2L9_9PROT|nr:DegT/DnrJ/EryC1/StrS family aminotransferase [Paramagnetospirillum kuznetsovii]RAU23599.1 erythromycin biosynthesis sensory transduction protein eryC1 [Paramagnetospirillum kuznetsovii]